MKSLFAIIAVLFLCTACGIEQIEEGSRGIKKEYGKIVGEPLMPGLYTYWLLGGSITELNVQEKDNIMKMVAFSDDTQEVKLLVSVTAKPADGQIGKIYSQYGEAYFTQIATNAIVGGIKDIMGKYKADQLSSVRGKVRAEVAAYLKEKLAPRHIDITGFDFVDMDFDEEYKAAVQRKVVALQNAEAAKNETETIKEEAKQTVFTATAAANAMKIMGEALAGNPKLVELEWVKKWDGKQPQYMLGGGSAPLINIK